MLGDVLAPSVDHLLTEWLRLPDLCGKPLIPDAERIGVEGSNVPQLGYRRLQSIDLAQQFLDPAEERQRYVCIL